MASNGAAPPRQSPVSSHRAALEAAVAELPTVDDDSWTVPIETLKAAGLEDNVTAARKYVLQFSLWAREAIGRLPPALRSAFEATDFNDYYKIVMSRVQFVYAQAVAGSAPGAPPPAMPLCSFQTQLRRRPVFQKGGQACVSCAFDLRGTFEVNSGQTAVGSLEESEAAFRALLASAGRRPFRLATLQRLVADRAPAAAAIEASLAPINDAWMAALDGTELFTLLPAGAAFSDGEGVEVKLIVDGGVATLLAQGPWFRVTFCETPLLQCMSQFFTDALCAEGDHDGAAWCREACFNFATAIHAVGQTCTPGSVALFSGRRAPHPDFHLLQHLYICESLGGMPTSSLMAGV